MKKKIFILFIFSMFGLLSFGSPERIQMSDPEPQHNHHDLPIPADQPDVFYDDDTQEIIVDGLGFVTYYDVEIASAATLTVLISTQVNGTYDTIDVSSLPTGHCYRITIESPSGNSFVGVFEIEENAELIIRPAVF